MKSEPFAYKLIFSKEAHKDAADEVVVYVKLQRVPCGFYIPTLVENYSHDWASSFNKGSVKHIFFIA